MTIKTRYNNATFARLTGLVRRLIICTPIDVATEA